MTPAAQDHVQEPWTDKKQSLIHSARRTGSGNDYSLSSNWDSLLDHRAQVDLPYQRSRLSIYGQDPVSGLRPAVLGRTAGSLVTQVVLDASPDLILILLD